MDQPGDALAQAVHVVVPIQKIRTGHLIPMSVVLQQGLIPAAGKVPVCGGVEIRPVLESGELAADLFPIDAHRCWKNPTTSATATSVDFFVRRSTTSTMPCGNFFPIVT